MPFPRLFSRPIQTAWSYQAPQDYIVWKLIPSSGLLVIDERDPTTFSSKLVAIEATTGRICWKSDSPFGAWWSNLTAVSGERAILEGYSAPDMPIAKGVAALDMATGELSWIDREAQLLQIQGTAVKVRSVRYGIERLGWRSILNGEELEHACDEALSAEGLYPRDAEIQEIEPYLSTADISALTGPIELLDHGDLRIVSFYLRNARSAADLLRETYRCELQVIRDRRAVYRETLAQHSPFPVAGNFVIESDILIYVQEKTRLVGVHLT